MGCYWRGDIVLDLPHLVLDAMHSAPSGHDPSVVGSYKGNDIDALGFELVILLYERWHVLDVAGRLDTQLKPMTFRILNV